MKAEQNKALIQRFFEEGLGRGNLAVVDEICAANLQLESPMFSMKQGNEQGLTCLKQWISATKTMLPDSVYILDDMVAEASMIAVGFTCVGIHSGEVAGIPATGEKVKSTQLCFAQIENNQISLLRFCPYGAPTVLNQLRA